MLASPGENDWLMHLGNYEGWSYSRLTQINVRNAGSLQLKWVFPMDEGGRQQMNPLVHDGVMFLSNNSSNAVQALDAKTGKPYWVHDVFAAGLELVALVVAGFAAPAPSANA